MRSRIKEQLRPILCIGFNLLVATSIIFANKVVLSVYRFHFVYALTFIHTVTSMVGMWLFAKAGLYEQKRLKAVQVFPLAFAFVGYVVFWNLSLQLNSVSFYQLSKIMISPTIVLVEAIGFQKLATRQEIISVMLLCIGVGLATIVEAEVSTSFSGVLMSIIAVLATCMYQIWAGNMQRDYQVTSMQLIDNYTRYAALIMCFVLPFIENLGIDWPFSRNQKETVISFPYTLEIVGAITLTSLLGLLVSWSTFLVIDATSTLTYSVVGNIKTIAILAGGIYFFKDEMPPLKIAAIFLALLGIIGYSFAQLNKPRANAVKGALSTTWEQEVSGKQDVLDESLGGVEERLIPALWEQKAKAKVCDPDR